MANTINFNAVYDGSIQPSEHSEVITADHFGLNLSFAWNQVGDIGWQNFDEIAEEMNSGTVRWPGGADGERYIVPEFDTNGDVVWDLDNVKKGNGGNTQSLTGFLDWCDETGTTATIIIPTSVFAKHWNNSDASFPKDSRFNPFADKNNLQSTIDDTNSTEYLNFKAAVKAYVKDVLTAAQTAGNVEIEAFEIGNEYSSFFNAKQYGQIASHMTLFIDEAIQEFKDDPANDPNYSPDPDTLVQTRSNLGSGGGHTVMTFEDLEQRADKIIEQFTPEALKKVDGIISHYYYREGEWSGVDPVTKLPIPSSVQSDYASLDEWFSKTRKLIDKWEDAREAAGMSEADAKVGWHFTEWNVNANTMSDKNDPDWADDTNYGMKQIAPLLEMFSAMVVNGVDAAQIWSARNHATSVGLQDHTGDTQLQIAGHLMKALQEQTVGKEYVELGVEDPNYDAHFFADADDGVLFLSSRKVSDPSSPQEIDVNLWSLGVNVDTVQVTIGKPDTGKMDTKFSVANLGDFDNVPSYLEPDVGLLWTTITVPVVDGVVQVDLGSYEVAYVNLPLPDRQVGDSANDNFTGTDAADHLVGNDGKDWLKGEGGVTSWTAATAMTLSTEATAMTS